MVVKQKGFGQILLLLVFLGVMLVGGVIYFQLNQRPQKTEQTLTQQLTSPKPQVNNTSQKETSFKTQRIGDFNFKYPADWQGGVDYDVSYIPLKSPDISFAIGGVLSTGMEVSAEYLDKQHTFFPAGTGSSSFQTLDQFETNLKANQYQDIKRTKISGLDALSFSQESQTQAGPKLKTYNLVIVRGEKVLTMGCMFNSANAPTNADSICSKILSSVS